MLEYQIPLTIGTNFKNAILLPQVLQVLEKLKSTNYLLYIASSAHTRHIRGIIEGTGLTKYFDQIYGFDNLEFMKSDKKFFRALFASQDFPSSKYVVIGNSAQEIIHSKSLGARTILIKHELGDRGEEKDLIKQAFDVADVVCETVEEILEILP
ncbi:MAG: HAD family hydrolase [Candidatus Hodarchaeota archaeon]